MFDRNWQARSPQRLPDFVWNASVNRIRAEFTEMPCLRVTCDEARRLFGLADPVAAWVLRHLANEGFLTENSRGEYVRRATHP